MYNTICACMKNNCCSKSFPKAFSDERMVDHVGFLPIEGVTMDVMCFEKKILFVWETNGLFHII